MLRNLLRELLPGSCLLCESPLAADEAPDLCRFCLATLPWNSPACPRCAEPLSAPGQPPGVAGPECERCRRQPPPFALALAPLCYEGPVRGWMLRLKDSLGMVEGRLLGTLLATAAGELYGGSGENPVRRPDLLVPVPLSAGRLARRGHNQALTLARPVARRLNVPLARHAVSRSRRRQRQRGLTRAERLDMPPGIFVSRRRWPASPCIAIVDDVMTTGSTAAQLARVLLAAGAGEVHVLCGARTRRQVRTRGIDSAGPADGSARGR